MSAPRPPPARDAGQAEHALQALLARLLAPAGLSFPQWATLVLLAQHRVLPSEALSRRLVDGGLLADDSALRETLDSLAWEGLVARREDEDAAWTLTAVGGARDRPLRQAVDARGSAVHGDLPFAALETTHRTLVEIAQRARTLLAA